jgi:rhodanese-related sulfurtransferase
MKNIVLCVTIVLCLVSCTQRKSQHITGFPQEDTANIILVDVRTHEEYAAGHLEGAVNINWHDPDFRTMANKLDKGKTIYLYCQKGGRSAKAATILDSLGYKVVDLQGGYSAWLQSKE